MISRRLGRSLWDLCLIWSFTCCYMSSGRNAAPRCKKKHRNRNIHETSCFTLSKNIKKQTCFCWPCQLVTVAGFLLFKTISLNDGRHLLCTSPESLWRFRWCHSPQGYNLHLGGPQGSGPGTKKHVQLSPQCRHHLKTHMSKFQWTILHSIISSPPQKKKHGNFIWIIHAATIMQLSTEGCSTKLLFIFFTGFRRFHSSATPPVTCMIGRTLRSAM